MVASPIRMAGAEGVAGAAGARDLASAPTAPCPAICRLRRRPEPSALAAGVLKICWGPPSTGGTQSAPWLRVTSTLVQLVCLTLADLDPGTGHIPMMPSVFLALPGGCLIPVGLAPERKVRAAALKVVALDCRAKRQGPTRRELIASSLDEYPDEIDLEQFTIKVRPHNRNI